MNKRFLKFQGQIQKFALRGFALLVRYILPILMIFEDFDNLEIIF